MKKMLFCLFIIPLTLLCDESILGSYFQKNSAVMMLIDPSSGEILKANRAAAEFYGYSTEKLQKMRIQEINTFSVAQVKAERVRAASEQRNYFIFRHKLADGTIKRVEVFSYPISYKDKKTLFSTIHDVSRLENAQNTIEHYSKNLEEQVDIKTKELLRQEKSLRYFITLGLLASLVIIITLAYNIRIRRKNEETLKEYKTILDTVGAYIYTKDIKGCYTYANDKVCKLFGLPLEEIIGHDDSKFFSLEISDDLKRNDQKVMENGEIVSNEERNIIAETQEERFYSTVKEPVRDSSGEIVGIFGVSTDITELKRMEKELYTLNDNLQERVEEEFLKRERNEQLLIQQSKMATMGEMIGAIAHQLKQPLNSISLYAQSIDEVIEYENSNPKELAEIEKKILEQVKHMDSTITDFRNFFKPSTVSQVFNPCHLAQNVYQLIESKMNSHSVELVIEAGDSIELEGVPNDFKQVVLNIFNNACDAFEKTDIEHRSIEISFDKSPEKTTIFIRDNAGGIAKNLLPDKLFDSYVSTKGEKGTGIGLQISRTIIEEKFGGKLWARNTKEGAEFIMEIPSN